jgi:excisionase family DNA binding protein
MNTREGSPTTKSTHQRSTQPEPGASKSEDPSISEAYRKALDAYVAYLRSYLDASKLGSRLTVKKAADLLGVHRNTLRRWSDMGLIEHKRGKRGRERTYLPQHVLNFLEETIFPTLDADSEALKKQTAEAYAGVIQAYKHYLTAYVDASKLGPKLTLRKAARVLGVHSNTLRRWSKEGSVSSFRFGVRGDRRFSLEDIWRLSRERGQASSDGSNTAADRMLGMREVAHILHVHENTVRNWADQGSLRCSRVGRRRDRRFSPRDVEEFARKMEYPKQDLEDLRRYVSGSQPAAIP